VVARWDSEKREVVAGKGNGHRCISSEERRKEQGRYGWKGVFWERSSIRAEKKIRKYSELGKLFGDALLEPVKILCLTQ
jgi:hypothetical protein